ncbi:MAG: hypothetical protein MJY74_01090 [Bacteroidaceae bacterium]|nr:hypothetical protein [Bacteroidaceae bacterium]
MASRRRLKKQIRYVIDELLMEYMLVESSSKNADKEVLRNALYGIVELSNEFIVRISHTEPGNAKAYYAVFYKDFNAKVNQIMGSLIQK